MSNTIATTGSKARIVAIHSIGDSMTVRTINVLAPPQISSLSIKGRFLGDASMQAKSYFCTDRQLGKGIVDVSPGVTVYQ